MNEEIRSKIKEITIKILLTIPALLIGIGAALLFILKPLKELWFPPQTPFEKAVEIALEKNTDSALNI
jgi:hypothetical protein